MSAATDAVIAAHPLFRGLDADGLRRALEFFSAAEMQYRRDEPLNRFLHPLEHFGLVLEGSVQVQMDDIDGELIIMATVEAGETFGESLCFLGVEAPVYIRAVSDARVLWMDTRRLRACGGRDAFECMMSDRFTAMLASRALAMNDRIQVLSKKSLRAKLATFFSQCVQRLGSRFELPLNRADMAAYLGTERSALSRELSNMRRDGLIDFEKNRFVIKTKTD
ncbi:MAG: Crp/Fnr family transcriptional regulator [Clostridia bacterium]|nr:Crp/Fnr family transcriptional regulator [Clostridia bacterium]